jgi:phage replication O-like protein O
MASPQTENGHIDIANELAEALCRINLSPYEWRILWVIFRKTYGWHKKADRISYTQFEEATGIGRWHINRALRRLAMRNIITISGNSRLMEYSFQKNYERWVSLPKMVTKSEKRSLPPGGIALPKVVTTSLPKMVNTKEKKEMYKRKSAPPTFEEYVEELRAEFPDINFEEELKKFHLYWAEGGRKLKRPKLALRNWITKANQWRLEKADFGWNPRSGDVRR